MIHRKLRTQDAGEMKAGGDGADKSELDPVRGVPRRRRDRAGNRNARHSTHILIRSCFIFLIFLSVT